MSGLEFKGLRTDRFGATGAVFGPPGIDFPFRKPETSTELVAAWDAHNDAHDPEPTVAAGDALRAALLAVEAKLAAIADLANDAGYSGLPSNIVARLREILGELPAGVLLTPDEAKRAIDAVVRGGFRTDNPADEALADRLEEVALRA